MYVGLLISVLVGVPPPGGAYLLDSERTLLLVQLRPDESRLLSGLSHRHVIRATQPRGEVRFDPERPADCEIDVSARVSDLEVDAPAMRREVGFDDILDEDDRADIREHMLDEDQLYAEKYPTLRFSGRRCEWMVDGQLQVQGNLTVRGVNHPLQLPMRVSYRNRLLRARGQFVLTHDAFGFEPYSAALGTLANDDWLKFTIEVVARPRAPTPQPPKSDEQTKTATVAE